MTFKVQDTKAKLLKIKNNCKMSISQSLVCHIFSLSTCISLSFHSSTQNGQHSTLKRYLIHIVPRATFRQVRVCLLVLGLSSALKVRYKLRKWIADLNISFCGMAAVSLALYYVWNYLKPNDLSSTGKIAMDKWQLVSIWHKQHAASAECTAETDKGEHRCVWSSLSSVTVWAVFLWCFILLIC